MTSTANHPRVVALALVAAGLILGLIVGLTALAPRDAAADGHVSGLENVVVDDVQVDHELGRRTSRQTVRIWGSGFAPGQEVILMVNDGPGTPSDITGFTSNRIRESGTIVANERGAWTTVWTLGRFTRQRSGIGPGDGDVERMRSLSVVDPGSFDVVTTTPLAFCRVTDRANAQAGINEMQAELDALQGQIDALANLEQPAGVSDAVWAVVGVLRDYILATGVLEARAMESAAAIDAAIEAKGETPQHCSA